MPGKALDRGHCAGWIREIVVRQFRHQAKRVGKSFLKEPNYVRSCGEARKTLCSLKRKKKNASERSVDIGQRDQHVIAPRPNVQGVGFEPMLTAGASGNS